MSFPSKLLNFLLALYGFGTRTWVKKRPGPIHIGPGRVGHGRMGHGGRNRLA